MCSDVGGLILFTFLCQTYVTDGEGFSPKFSAFSQVLPLLP